MKSLVPLALAAALIPGCGTGPLHSSSEAASCSLRSELYFGQKAAGGLLFSAQQWNDFVNTNITPHFPAGFTILDAQGSWRNAAGQMESEPVKVLVVLLPCSSAPAVDQKLQALASDYLRDFHQEAVLRDDSPAVVLLYTNAVSSP